MKKYSVHLLVILLIVSCLQVKAVPDDRKEVVVDFFIMSMCPFSIQAEKYLEQLKNNFGDSLKINFYYIASENKNNGSGEKPEEKAQDIPPQTEGVTDDKCIAAADASNGRFSSLHGQAEVQENIRQLVLLKYFPEIFWQYLNERNKDIYNTDPVEILKSLKVDTDFVEGIVASEEGENLLVENIRESETRNVNASPTIYVNDKQKDFQLSLNSLGRILCRESSIDFCNNLPVCGSELDCEAKEGMVTACINPETPEAKCIYGPEVEFSVTIINNPEIALLKTDDIENAIRETFKKANIIEINYSDQLAQQLILDYKIESVPFFIFDKKVEESIKFQQFSAYLTPGNNNFYINPVFIPNRYYINRPEIKNSLELFVHSHSQMAMRFENILMAIMRANFSLNYIVDITKEKTGNEVLLSKQDSGMTLEQMDYKYNISSRYGPEEIRENIKQLCIYKYHPDLISAYLRCYNNDAIRKLKDSKCNQLVLGDRLQELEKCRDSNEGLEMLANNATYTNSFNVRTEVAVLVKNRILLQDFEINDIFRLMDTN